ncbi:helix-turn-helix domain-containing protein [Candidatus Aminicenantes bacterium AC-334-K16]|nr:helix-turn-helix domain-containing protein [Candidatus Aminicenantes bacterium AC-334-K16]
MHPECPLQHTGRNKSKAAKILGIHPSSLFRKLKDKQN